MIKEAMCSFEVAKLLKEAGFDEPCLRYFDTNTEDEDLDYVLRIWSNEVEVPNSKLLDTEYACCTQQMAVRWLIENKKISIEVNVGQHWLGRSVVWYCSVVSFNEHGKRKQIDDFGVRGLVFDYPEDATNYGLLFYLTKIKEEKDEKEQI